jgi:hypothetical protein
MLIDELDSGVPKAATTKAIACSAVILNVELVIGLAV